MYTRAQAIEFWYEFDQLFLFDRTPEVNEALSIAYPNGSRTPSFTWCVIRRPWIWRRR